MDYKKYLKDKYFILFLLILILGIGLRLYYFNINSAVWWDEAEYLTRAKEYAGITNIDQDVWSQRRPFLLVLLWAFLYKLGASEIHIRITQFLFSISSLFAIYLLAKEAYDEKIALITTLALAPLGLHLFLTARFLTEVPAISMVLFSYFLFFKYYINENNYQKPWLPFLFMGLFMGLAIAIRASLILGLIPIIIIILIKESFLAIKNKKIWVASIATIIPNIPYLIYLIIRNKTINPITVSAKLTGIGEGRFQFSLDPWLFIDYLQYIPHELKWVYFILMIIGLYLFIEIILGFDILLKNKDKKLYRELFLVMWIIIPPLFFGFLTSYSPFSYAEPRYILPMFPGLLMLSANGLLFIGNLFKRINKKMAIIFILIILLIATYNQIIYADKMIIAKKDSFYPLRPAGEFLKGKTTNMIMSNSNQMELMYYAETYVEGFDDKEEDFLKKIKKNSVDYVAISTLYQNNKPWHYEVPQKYQQYLKPVFATYYDKEKKQLAVLAMEVNKEEIAKI